MNKSGKKISAVIFDMDGVIIDSGWIWKKAEKEIFSSVGVELTADLCEITESLTTAEVTQFWFNRFPWKGLSLEEVENKVIERVASLIREKGEAINGVEKFIKTLKSKGYKTGLATNSPPELIHVVLEKFRLEGYFDVKASAVNESLGKPNPSVYLTAAKTLNTEPKYCIAIEDSSSGLEAAKRAGMKTAAILHGNTNALDMNMIDYKINRFDQFDYSVL